MEYPPEAVGGYPLEYAIFLATRANYELTLLGCTCESPVRVLLCEEHDCVHAFYTEHDVYCEYQKYVSRIEAAPFN